MALRQTPMSAVDVVIESSTRARCRRRRLITGAPLGPPRHRDRRAGASMTVMALPLAGLGVLDAALVVAYTETAGAAAEPEIVAALVVWRVVTLIGTLLLGALTFGWWRWQISRGRLAPADDPSEGLA
jgi:hypothetical protein